MMSDVRPTPPMVVYINTAHGQELFDPANKEHRMLMAWSNFCVQYGFGIISFDEWMNLFEVPEGTTDPWTTTAS